TGTQSTAGTTGLVTSSTVTQRDIGIQLKVLPLIGKDGSVQLQVTQQVEDVLGSVTIDGNEQLALTKAIAVHPIRRTITHADLIVVRRGEKVTVEVPVALEGEAANGTLVTQDSTTIEIEAEALSIPESLTVSIEGAEEGTQITAGQIALPEGVTLISDPEMLVVNIVVAPTAEDLEAEGAGEVSEAEGAEAAEGEAEPAEGEEAGASAGGESKPAEGE
ncbi:MAG: 50S ribosomal protein L25, partial [Mycobacteriaceae bacterium]|nr:50S ribosomal protein L25 [Mycobacteriaceae bacterium]